MKQDTSAMIRISTNALEYKFVSMGKKKMTGKLVQFSKIGETPIYNLGFGDLLQDETLNKQSGSDHNYRDRALVAVAAIVYEFTARNPHNHVFFTGSDPVRTKLFKRVLAASID